jgi:hypothetical protein
MAARIDDDFMIAEFGRRVIATALYSSHAAADGQGAWVVYLPQRSLRLVRIPGPKSMTTKDHTSTTHRAIAPR